MLQEVDILARVIQRQEISWSPTDDSASHEITAELDMSPVSPRWRRCISLWPARMCSRHCKNHIELAIRVWDAHEGLSEDEALVAKKSATFPLKCEHVLPTDNGGDGQGAGASSVDARGGDGAGDGFSPLASWRERMAGG